MTAAIAIQPPLDPEDRTKFLGASDMAAVLGVDPYKTPLQLYEEKTGLVLPFTGNAHTRRGLKLEDLAAAEFAETTGKQLRRVSRRFAHDVYPFITGKIDRLVVGEDAIGEIKCPSLGMFHRIKRTGLHEGYIVQVNTYLGLTRKSIGYWIIFCADQMELVVFPVEFDAQLYNSTVDRAVSFWLNHVVPRVPPPAAQPDEERLEIRRAEGAVPRFDLSADVEFVAAAEMLREAKALAKEAEILHDEAKDRVLSTIADTPGVYVAPGLQLSYTMSKGRSGFDKKALANVMPLDTVSTALLLRKELFDTVLSADQMNDLEKMILGECRLDLSQFETRGKDFPMLRLSVNASKEAE